MEFEIHPIQADILLVLLFKPCARFSELKTTEISSDHLTFHIKRLLKHGLMEKTGNLYKLTPKGKEFANRFDTDSVVVERQAKVAILVVAIKKDKGKQKYLMQKRLKQPFFGVHGFVTGKIRWGETLDEAAERELVEETGLSGSFKLAGVEHKIDYSPDKKLLEDKFFFIMKATDLKGRLVRKFDGGENIWKNYEEILNEKNKFQDVEKIMAIICKKKFEFFEKRYRVEKY